MRRLLDLGGAQGFPYATPPSSPIIPELVAKSSSCALYLTMAAQDSTLKENEEVGVHDAIAEKSIFEWSAQARPFRRRTREFYVTAASIGVLFGLILFLIDGIMPVLLMVGFGFLFYVLHNVEPEKAEYKITNYGLRVSGSLIPWDNIGRFWFSERLGSDVLVLETGGLIGRIELVYDKKDREKLEKTLKKYLLHEEAAPTILDKSANWVAGKIQ